MYAKHKEHIRTVFQRIEEFGFKLSAEKCEFFLKQIKYLVKSLTAKAEDRILREQKPLRRCQHLSMLPSYNLFWV